MLHLESEQLKTAGKIDIPYRHLFLAMIGVNQILAGFASAFTGAVTGFLIQVLFFHTDYGTDYGWLFWLVGIILVIGSFLQTKTELKTRGALFGTGYLSGLLFSSICGL